jgi:hypothetical protein
MNELNVNEVKEVNGGIINVAIGAVVGGASQYASGGSGADIARGVAFGALTGGFGVMASGATGAMRVFSSSFSVLMGMIASDSQ